MIGTERIHIRNYLIRIGHKRRRTKPKNLFRTSPRQVLAKSNPHKNNLNLMRG